MSSGNREDGRALAVFLANFNHGHYLPQALDALCAQSVQPGRIWLVDDASTDNSRAVIEDYRQRYPELLHVTLLDCNQGFLANATKWLKTVESEFVLFAAADDAIYPDLFRKSLALLRQFPQAGLCSALSRQMDEHGNDLGLFHTPIPRKSPGYISPSEARRLLIYDDGWFMGNTVIYRTEALRKIGFDPSLGSFSDGFVCRAVALQHGACFIPENLGYWRRLPNSLSQEALNNPNIARNIIDRSTALMSDSFTHLFPKEYIRRLRGRSIFWSICAYLNLPRQQARQNTRELLRSSSWFDKTLLTEMAVLPIGLRWIGKFGLFLWLRPYDLVIVARRALRRIRD